MAGEATKRVPIAAQLKTMGGNFWVANLIEAGERLAFFGVRAIVPLYMYGADSVLHLSMTEKGVIFGIWALLQCLVPMISGGYTDAYGYKKSMYLAFVINIIGYVCMASANGFWSMLGAAMLVGTGTAIFKPPVQGAVAKSLNEGNSGLGFGLFYWIVNIGGFFAPMAAAVLRGNEAEPTWNYVFYGAAVVTALNFLPTLFLFKEPEIDVVAKAKSPFQVFADSLTTLVRDRQMLRFLLIISGFWFMFMQLWDLLPNFISEWVDTRDVGSFLTAAAGTLGADGASGFLTAEGATKPEIMINIDSFAIILFVLPLSWFLGRYRMMGSLIIGIAVSVVGFVGTGTTNVGYICALMIFVFAIGEIICSPKFSEYVGMTAPPDKKALYMGYSNIPFAIGWAGGNFLSGPLYDALSSRTRFARDYLIEQLGMSREAAEALEPNQVMPTLVEKLGDGADTFSATQVLWDANSPWVIWWILGVIGLTSLVGMILFNRRARSAVDGTES
ncbi:MAG: MFS transporter [Akkermansiaceae bacterium]|nr:MFS transporter [Akkermansiaceae bacterium]